MQISIAYNNEGQVRYDGKEHDIKKGFKLWVDIINPTSSEISEIAKSFKLDKFAIEAIEHKYKKP